MVFLNIFSDMISNAPASGPAPREPYSGPVLQQSLLASAASCGDDAVAVVDMDLRVAAANEAFARLSGLSSPDELVGGPSCALFGLPPDSEFVRGFEQDNVRARGLSPGNHISRKESFPAADGSPRFLLLKIYPAFDAQRRLLGTATVATDVTGQVMAERDAQRFREALDSSTDAVFIYSAESGRFVDVNRTACQYWGYSREELLSMTPAG